MPPSTANGEPVINEASSLQLIDLGLKDCNIEIDWDILNEEDINSIKQLFN